ARGIARTFVGQPGSFTRSANRKDFALPPVRDTLLEYAAVIRGAVTGEGKSHDMFYGMVIKSSIFTSSNIEGIEAVKMLISQGGGAQDDGRHLVFANLVDFDMLYGHRNNVEGYADALREFDAQLPEMIERLRPYDVLVVTADHGCD